MIENHGPIPTSNYMVGRNGTAITKIVLHTMVGWISAADARFKNVNSQVSATYGVRVDGTVWEWVAEGDTAYHAGNWPVNLASIGIEHEDGGDYMGVRPDALYAASAALVRDICGRYGIPVVRGTGGPGIYDHRAVSATACPDALDTDRIIREAQGVDVTPAEVDARIAVAIAAYGARLEVELDQRRDDTVRAAIKAVSTKLAQ